MCVFYTQIFSPLWVTMNNVLIYIYYFTGTFMKADITEETICYTEGDVEENITTFTSNIYYFTFSFNIKYIVSDMCQLL